MLPGRPSARVVSGAERLCDSASLMAIIQKQAAANKPFLQCRSEPGCSPMRHSVDDQIFGRSDLHLDLHVVLTMQLDNCFEHQGHRETRPTEPTPSANTSQRPISSKSKSLSNKSLSDRDWANREVQPGALLAHYCQHHLFTTP